MNFFYMTAGGRIANQWKMDDIYVSSLDVRDIASVPKTYFYDEKLSDICLWLAENAREFSVGVCYGIEHGEALEYKYEIFILDDDEAIQFKLIWM
jgi:hypothetical protein